MKDARHAWTAESIGLLMLLGVYVAWMLSLPAWPSQDGPVHLFYTEVLGKLLSHGETSYRAFYTVKHFAPPYALYYYLLLLLSWFVPLFAADRLVICGYLVTFLLGFRYLARALGPPRSADRAALLASLLALNWALGMGFVNYDLSLAISLWALGLWFRLPERNTLRRRVLFVFLVALLTLAHPVPLLFVLALTGADLAVAAVRRAPRPWPADLLTFGAALVPLLYVMAFTQAHPLQQRTRTTGSLPQIALRRAIGYAQGKSLSLLFGSSPAVSVYRAALLLLLVVALAAALQQRLRNHAQRRWTTADLFLGFALVLLFGLPWLPSDISGAYFFSERLTILVWICALLACAGIFRPSPTHGNAVPLEPLHNQMRALLVLAVGAATACLLRSADQAIRPFAVRDLALSKPNLVHEGDVVLALEATQVRTAARGAIPSWNPEYWDAVIPVRTGQAVLANAPWLDSAIIPLAAGPTLPGVALPPTLANSPHALADALRADPSQARKLLNASTAVLFSPAISDTPEPILAAGQPPQTAWTCTRLAVDAARLCTRARRQSSAPRVH